MSAPLTKTEIWGAPLALSFASTIGLLSALLGDGAWDVLSWLGLGAPLIAILWYVVRSASSQFVRKVGSQTIH